MISRVQPPPSMPPTHISHHLHRLRRCRPICIFQHHLFLSTSLPSSPRSPAHQVFCYCRLSIRSPLLAVAVNAHHSRSYPSSSACRAQLRASWAPTQDHALEELDVTSYRTFLLVFVCFIVTLFCLSSRALFQPVLFLFFSLDFELHRCLSTSCPLSHSKPIHSLTSNLNTGLIIIRRRAVCRQVNLNFTRFSLFFPRLLTLVHKVQTVPVDSELYKYHRMASLNSRHVKGQGP